MGRAETPLFHADIGVLMCLHHRESIVTHRIVEWWPSYSYCDCRCEVGPPMNGRSQLTLTCLNREPCPMMLARDIPRRRDIQMMLFVSFGMRCISSRAF